MADEYSIVDIWAGDFPDEASLESYLEEAFTDDENDPISNFAKDQRQAFYNGQLLESGFHSRSSDFTDLLKDHSFAESYKAQAAAAFRRSGMGSANVVIMAFGNAIDNPISVSNENYRLGYIGRFACVPRPYSGGDAPIPPTVFLNIQDGPKLSFGGGLTSSVPVSARGLTIGQSKREDSGPRLDVSAIVPDVAVDQVKIYQDQFEQWVIEDVGNNSLTQIGKEPFNLSRSFPWNGTRLAIGDLVFVWSVKPAT